MNRNFIIKTTHVQQSILLLLLVIFFCSCNKEPVTPPVIIHETGTVKDIDGRIYNTIKIGNQWWMAEDLQVTKYRNGISINEININNNDGWKSDINGAYCIESISKAYLYNWYAISNDSNIIAPDGWHIPSDEEWKALEMHLGMKKEEADKFNWRGYNEGDKLKINYPNNSWIEIKSSSVWGTNESGFTALSTGCRMFDGVFGDKQKGCTGFWWASTENLNKEAFYRHLDYKNSNIFRYAGSKNYGFAIRCVKD